MTMNSFLNNIRSNFNNRESIIKGSILSNLSENVKEIQFEQHQNHSTENLLLELSDSTNSLCITIEAIFLHGLKDSFLRQTINVIAPGEIDRKPEPNFWPPLLVFSHKQTIEQIQSLSQIKTDIGYCRAWIRQSLNDGLLSSHLSNIRKNQSALTPYYKGYGFLRDPDNILLAEGFIGGIEASTTFSLPINSSLLNHWTNHPLQMAGLYIPPLRSCIIASGVDVANSLTNTIETEQTGKTVDIPIPKPVQTNQLFNESISNSPFAMNPFNQYEQKLKKSPKNESIESDVNELNVELSDDDNITLLLHRIDEMGINSAEMTEQNKRKLIGNSLTSKTGWSTTMNKCDLDDNRNNECDTGAGAGASAGGGDNQGVIERKNQEKPNDLMISRSNSMTTSISSLRSPIDRHSYNSLLARHSNRTKTVNLRDVWERFETSLRSGNAMNVLLKGNENNNQNTNKLKSNNGDDEGENDHKEVIKNLGFELIDDCETAPETFNIDELRKFVEYACNIAHEKGIDSQGFTCKSCPNPLSVGNRVPQVCTFTGSYYCDSCMSNELYLIPSRIVHNWDFRKYFVSKKAATFLVDFQYQPFIDLKLLNPNIYQAIDEMSQLQSLRIQLNFIRAYLFTCCSVVIEKFQKLMESNEHLYEHIHRYSINDFQQIQKDLLGNRLQKAVTFGREHILECRLCSQKGFICEICNSSKVLYPFDIETTFRCEICGAVFHDYCLDASVPCPKCERRRKREDLPLLNAVRSTSTVPDQLELNESQSILT